MVTPARRSPGMPEFITPKTESDSASDGTAETLSPWRTPLPVTPDTPVSHQSSPEVVEEVVPAPDAGLRRSTRVRHAPQRYSPTSYYCSAVFTRPAPRPQSQLSLTQVLTLLFLALCVRTNGEVLLSSQLGPARLCLKHAEGHYIELGPPPSCKIEPKFSVIENVFVTPYFKRTLSDNFPIYSCTLEIEKTITFMSFFGGHAITGHSIEYQLFDEATCRREVSQIESHQTKLIQINPYTWTNSTSVTLAYSWCCADKINMEYKLLIQTIFTSYNFQTKKLFSPSIDLHRCDPEQTACVVDKQQLIWQLNIVHSCSLIQGQTVSGEKRDTEIVSVEGQLTVTLTGQSALVCNKRVLFTQEGVYVTKKCY
jgi:hypothetical protein